ncbi:hypothetical protein BDZ45DRAFT_743189 [Acephala macrosclerotiorum]|nr:hypothetical protein BDZ45DRAFT_743189 [Acephala macrosclerotiorum]
MPGQTEIWGWECHICGKDNYKKAWVDENTPNNETFKDEECEGDNCVEIMKSDHGATDGRPHIKCKKCETIRHNGSPPPGKARVLPPQRPPYR